MSYNQYKGVIHKHLVKDDPCWENYEMVGTKIQDGKEVPNCVPKKEKDDEPVEKYNERVYFKELDKLTRRNIPTFMMSEHLTNKFGIELREAKQILQRYMRNQKKDNVLVEKNFTKYLEFEMKQLITLIKRKDARAEKKALYILKQINNLGK
tara:strand:+ start:1438 stop:1893 length:456 start_codon:yes stop_codon:yes gene_type:complete